MNLVIKSDYESLSLAAAQAIIELSKQKKEVNICLPTGTTPKGMYKALVDLHQAGQADFSFINWFTLDEYLGIPLSSPFSCYQQITELFYEPTGINKDRIFTFNSEAKDLDAEAARYNAIIEHMGGLDLAIVGIGMNGHVGFNEPGSSANAPTRVIDLHERTLVQSKKYFTDDHPIPTKGITLGMKTLLQSKEVFVVANGEEKADIVKFAIHGPVSDDVPVSHFQTHAGATFLLDTLAASKLK